MEFLKNESHSPERRKFPRLNTTVDIEYAVVGKEPAPQDKSYIKNISSGGICIIVYEKVEIDDILTLTINLPEGGRPIQLKGKVVWTGEFILGGDKRSRWDAGIEFIEISEDDRQKISKYLFALHR